MVSLLATVVLARTGKQASVLGLGGVTAFLGAVYILVRRVGAEEFGLGNARHKPVASS